MSPSNHFNFLLHVVLLLHSVQSTIVPKPLTQTTSTDILYLDAKTFNFSATASSLSPLLSKAFSRYSTLFSHQQRSLSSSSLADQRSLDWLLSTSIINPTEYAELTNRIKPTTATANKNSITITGVDVHVALPDQVKTLTTDESYTLHVLAPRIQITAPTVYGAIYALESLSQLLSTDANSKNQLCLNSTLIQDKPRFQFRATMIDTARHWYPISSIKQHLDAMSTVKMNVLHWHIVDSQSFPFVSQHLPALSQDGAWSPSHIYTVTDIQDLVQYANERGIRIIPEFDTPGHVSAGWESFGVLTNCSSKSTGGRGTHPLNPTLNKTYAVLQTLWTDVLAAFAPETFVHIGGDEVWHTANQSCWTSNPQIQEYLSSHPEINGFSGLESIFEKRLLDILHGTLNASVVVWQEIFDNGANPAPGTIVDVWKSDDAQNASVYQEEMRRVTDAGYHAVLSAPFYLNIISYGMDWWTYYQVEPANFTGGEKAEEDGKIAGIEACYWSEFIDGANFISRAWPRTAAIAERGWSSKDVRDGKDAQNRFHALRCLLLQRGINAEPIGVCSDPGCTSQKHGSGGDVGGVRDSDASSSLPIYGPFPGLGGSCPKEWVSTYKGIGAG